MAPPIETVEGLLARDSDLQVAVKEELLQQVEESADDIRNKIKDAFGDDSDSE